jgi:hypothetical protein
MCNDNPKVYRVQKRLGSEDVVDEQRNGCFMEKRLVDSLAGKEKDSQRGEDIGVRQIEACLEQERHPQGLFAQQLVEVQDLEACHGASRNQASKYPAEQNAAEIICDGWAPITGCIVCENNLREYRDERYCERPEADQKYNLEEIGFLHCLIPVINNCAWCRFRSGMLPR